MALDAVEERQLAILQARVDQICSNAIKPPVLDWLEEHIRYPHSDRAYRFRRDFAYWLNGPLEAITSGFWRVVSVVAPVGSGKTTLLESVACYITAADPGPLLIVGQSDADIELFGETRLGPMLRDIPATAALMPQKANRWRKTEIIFNHMPMYLAGANLTSLQAKSVRYVILDELWLYKKSLAQEAIRRTHDRSNSVVVALGQAGVVGDEHDTLHQSCLQHVLGWTCPECATWHEYNFRRDMKYQDTRDERGIWDYRGLVESVHMLCPRCETKFSDTEDNRRLLSRSGTYRPIPCNPRPERIGFAYSVFAVWWIPWATTVMEFVDANAARKLGNLVPLRQLIQKRFAEFWSDDDEAPEVTFQSAGYSQAEMEDGHSIENEVYRFLTADRQRDHFWAVARAWRADGSSRLLYAGRLIEWSQINVLEERYKIARANFVFLDAGFDTSAIYSFCALHGYTALMGDKANEFVHRKGRKVTRRFYSPVERINLGGSQAILVRWSNLRIKDVLGRLRSGGIAPFEIPNDVISDYPDQMTSEIKKEVVNKATGEVSQRWVRIGSRANHLWDCECMQVVAANMMGCLRLGDEETGPEN
jgi:hypothetical protein